MGLTRGVATGCHISHAGDTVSAKVPKRLGVVIGEFHDQLMNDCLEDARLAAVSMGAEITQVLAIPTAPRESDFQVAKGALVLYSTRLA